MNNAIYITYINVNWGRINRRGGEWGEGKFHGHKAACCSARALAQSLFGPTAEPQPGLTAHLGWARLLVDRHRDLVQVPAAAGQHTSGSRNPHHFTPDDEEAYEHENYFNPDTTPHHDSHSN